ncbi:hypothetical protein CcCBS67573_g03812 [Chytriomyces confervae]|uniref:Methyltransferase type 12 domain-containing protein n=1 Tax=Chytriomyces confervae TaxID=246404 RepID=A0A507FF97_9FUNG|nr:hypothetical protein CcCBS67573_g03812 [Chytriomyces confervae]
MNRSRAPLIMCGVFAYCSSAYLGFHLYKVYNLPTPPATIADPMHQRITTCTHNHGVYSAMADRYDDEIGWDEWLMGLERRRKRAVERCNGLVLETAAGTGRNLSHFAKNTTTESLTLTDASAPMLQKAFQLLKAISKDAPSTSSTMPPVKFSVLDTNGTIPPENVGHFDTVLDTFGLCSMQDPVQSLENMREMLKSGGKMVLLEHGRSDFPLFSEWINAALDKTAQFHADRWGCWWNRDLEAVVRGVGGLKIESVERFHFGTTIEIVAVKE